MATETPIGDHVSVVDWIWLERAHTHVGGGQRAGNTMALARIKVHWE
jgi:hypothetical protein